MIKKIRISKNIEDGFSNPKRELHKNFETQLNSVSFGTEEFQKKNTQPSETNDWWNDDWGDEEDYGF